MNRIDALSGLVWAAVISVPLLLDVDCISQILASVSRSFYE